MDERESLTEARIRRDLAEKLTSQMVEGMLGVAMIALPALIFGLFLLVLGVYWAAAVCFIPVLLLLFHVLVSHGVARRRYARMPIVLSEVIIDDVLADVRPSVWKTLSGHRRLLDCFVLPGYGRVEIPKGLEHLKRGESCYLLKDPRGRVVHLYSSRTWRFDDVLLRKEKDEP